MLKLRNPDKLYPYIPKCEQELLEKDKDAKVTVLWLKPPSAEFLSKVIDRTTEMSSENFDRTKGTSITFIPQLNLRNYILFRVVVEKIDNLRDTDGNEITVPPRVKDSIFGDEIYVLPKYFVDKFPQDIISEIGEAVVSGSYLDEDDKKN